MYRISAIICTYNRADLLRLAIESLCHQTLSASDYEIIVVDNNCTDHTPQVVVQLQAQYPQIALQRLEEKQPGAGFARNAGATVAQAPYLAFLDDDAKAHEDWLQQILHTFEQIQPMPYSVGGDILTFSLQEPPTWFKTQYEEMRWGNEAHWLTESEPPFWGPNMSWRRDIFLEVGGLPTDRGPKGTAMLAGEESALYLRLWAPQRFYFSPKVLVYHIVYPAKMHLSYRLKREFMLGQSNAKQLLDGASWQRRLYLLGGSTKGLLVYIVQALARVGKHPYWQQWVVEDWGLAMNKLGWVLQFLGIRITFKRG